MEPSAQGRDTGMARLCVKWEVRVFQVVYNLWLFIHDLCFSLVKTIKEKLDLIFLKIPLPPYSMMFFPGFPRL